MIPLRSTATAEDLFAIDQALFGYTAGIDRNDYEFFRPGFNPNVRVTFAERIPTLEGLDRLAAFMEALHRDVDGSAHRRTNLFFTDSTPVPGRRPLVATSRRFGPGLSPGEDEL